MFLGKPLYFYHRGDCEMASDRFCLIKQVIAGDSSLLLRIACLRIYVSFLVTEFEFYFYDLSRPQEANAYAFPRLASFIAFYA